MDGTLVERAAELARTDGEFRLNAHDWTGVLRLCCGEQTWAVPFVAGEPGPTDRPDRSTPPRDAVHDVTISAGAEQWDELLRTTPAPGFVDVFAAAGSGVTVVPMPESGARHLALRRFGELLRDAHNGTDPSPVVQPNHSRHGRFDAATGHYVHLDLDGLDHRVYFEEAGTGIGLLCQHTAGADGRQWRRILEDARVTSKYRVIVYDMPYHGKSLPPEGRAWWAERYTVTVESAMALPLGLADALGLDRPVFIGSSIGGMLALDLARYHPDELRAVIALEGGLHVDLPDGALEASQRGAPDAHAAVMMMIMSPTASQTARQETRLHYAQGAPGVFAGDIDYYGVHHDLRAEVDGFDTGRCPVHLLTGEYDFPTVPWTERAAREIDGATSQIMEGLGHFPMSEDHEGLMHYVLPILDAIADDG